MINSDCSWNELRSHYRQLIQKWHPDKFEAEPEKKAAADEKIKHINIAYNELSTHYRKYGELPVIEKPADTSHKPTETKPGTSKKTSPPHRKQKKDTNKPDTLAKKKPIILTITLVAILMYGLFEFPEQENIQHKKTRNDNHQPVTSSQTGTKKTVNKNGILNKNTKADNKKNRNKPDTSISTNDMHTTGKRKSGKYFTYGSSIGEVIAIQGPPSKIENDAWYYGNSIVYFSDGEVIRWEHRPENPLKARLSFPQPAKHKR